MIHSQDCGSCEDCKDPLADYATIPAYRDELRSFVDRVCAGRRLDVAAAGREEQTFSLRKRVLERRGLV